MAKRWGFYLPVGLHGRGRGSRAVLKWLKSGALVHDASYYQPVQLEGTEDSILSILRMVTLPSPSGFSEEISHPVDHGVCYRNAMLYNVGTPHSQFIAPVIYMWRPLLKERNNRIAEQVDGSDGGSIFDESKCSTLHRQLWIWIHAAAFEEGFDALKSACQKQMNDTGASVSCFSLEGKIAKLEIMGSKATEVLQKILHPISESCSTSSIRACTNSRLQKPFILEHADDLPAHAILSLTVTDPRDAPNRIEPVTETTTKIGIDFPEEDDQSLYASVSELPTENKDAPNRIEPVTETTTKLGIGFPEEDDQSLYASVSELPTENKDASLFLWSKPDVNGVFLSDSNDLWDSGIKLNPPVPDDIFCAERHRMRLNFFKLDSANHETTTSEARDDFSHSCSVLLLKHASRGNFNAGWSIVLPLSWVKTLWISLVSNGAHAIGLRERRWIACNNGLPTFPSDFPDCKAYSLLMAAEAAAFDKSAELRPLAVRPSRVPIPPPWDCIASTIKKELKLDGDFQALDVQIRSDVAPARSMSASGLQNSESSLSDQSPASFKGFIPRISNVLSRYLEKSHDRTIELMPADSGLCLVRVLIHAFKEGVFEEGAIVCAPILSDLSRWEFRLDEEDKLEIPQAIIKSYFTQQDSGKWELQLQDDCSTPELYRWPIGFITSGFVRGGTKPVAQAFCEAKLLSELREQQAKQLMEKAKPEIFVLVRNLRSAAYRRALATVVLFQDTEDTEFM